MQTVRTARKLFVSLTCALLLGVALFSATLLDAAPSAKQTKKLALNERLIVKREGCELWVASQTPSKIVVRCAATNAPSHEQTASPDALDIILYAGNKLVAKAIACRLETRVVSKTRIVIQCSDISSSETLTATPNILTQTDTLTETNTANNALPAAPASTNTPTKKPTNTPTKKPTNTPTKKPTNTPTKKPTNTPTKKPTNTPTKKPTNTPTKKPTNTPTKKPTNTPTKTLTPSRTRTPSRTPTSSRTPTPTNTFTPTTTPVPFFGMDERSKIVGHPTAVALAQNAHVTWVRSSIWWKSVQSQRGVFDFASTDAYLMPIIDAGFVPVVYLEENPSWIANTPCGPINTDDATAMADFATFVTTVVQRYPQVRIWGLYNEPDNSTYARSGYSSGGCFGDNVTNDINGNGVNDRVEYARMLAGAWKAVHQANPNARLAIGAVAYDFFDGISAPPGYSGNGHFNYNFLDEVFAYMQANPLPAGEAYTDLVMFNYYDIYSRAWEKVASGKGIQAKANQILSRMTAHNLTLPLFVGESGVDSNKFGQNGQAYCLQMTMVRGAAAGLHGVIWWTFGDEPTSNWYYGVVTDATVPKTSYYAYQTLAREMIGYRYSRTLTKTTGFADVEAYQFSAGTKTKTILWSAVITTEANAPCASQRSAAVATFGPDVTRLRVTSYLGAASAVTDNSASDLDTRVGYIAIQVKAAPVIAQPNP